MRTAIVRYFTRFHHKAQDVFSYCGFCADGCEIQNYFSAGLAIASAAWYIIERAKQHGALAQMVARYIRIVEATGSNPVCSTNHPRRLKSFLGFSHN